MENVDMGYLGEITKEWYEYVMEGNSNYVLDSKHGSFYQSNYNDSLFEYRELEIEKYEIEHNLLGEEYDPSVGEIVK